MIKKVSLSLLAVFFVFVLVAFMPTKGGKNLTTFQLYNVAMAAGCVIENPESGQGSDGTPASEDSGDDNGFGAGSQNTLGPTTKYTAAALLAQNTSNVDPKSRGPLTLDHLYDRNGYPENDGKEVKVIQMFLNVIRPGGEPVATSGAGSMGNETEHYGRLTAMAVERFQHQYGGGFQAPESFPDAFNNFGPCTRYIMNVMLNDYMESHPDFRQRVDGVLRIGGGVPATSVTATGVQSGSTVTNRTTAPASCFVTSTNLCTALSTNLAPGACDEGVVNSRCTSRVTNQQVATLQAYLLRFTDKNYFNGEITCPTGYYGPLTATAVNEFIQDHPEWGSSAGTYVARRVAGCTVGATEQPNTNTTVGATLRANITQSTPTTNPGVAFRIEWNATGGAQTCVISDQTTSSVIASGFNTTGSASYAPTALGAHAINITCVNLAGRTASMDIVHTVIPVSENTSLLPCSIKGQASTTVTGKVLTCDGAKYIDCANVNNYGVSACNPFAIQQSGLGSLIVENNASKVCDVAPCIKNIKINTLVGTTNGFVWREDRQKWFFGGAVGTTYPADIIAVSAGGAAMVGFSLFKVEDYLASVATNPPTAPDLNKAINRIEITAPAGTTPPPTVNVQGYLSASSPAECPGNTIHRCVTLTVTTSDGSPGAVLRKDDATQPWLGTLTNVDVTNGGVFWLYKASDKTSTGFLYALNIAAPAAASVGSPSGSVTFDAVNPDVTCVSATNTCTCKAASCNVNVKIGSLTNTGYGYVYRTDRSAWFYGDNKVGVSNTADIPPVSSGGAAEVRFYLYSSLGYNNGGVPNTSGLLSTTPLIVKVATAVAAVTHNGVCGSYLGNWCSVGSAAATPVLSNGVYTWRCNSTDGGQPSPTCSYTPPAASIPQPTFNAVQSPANSSWCRITSDVYVYRVDRSAWFFGPSTGYGDADGIPSTGVTFRLYTANQYTNSMAVPTPYSSTNLGGYIKAIKVLPNCSTSVVSTTANPLTTQELIASALGGANTTSTGVVAGASTGQLTVDLSYGANNPVDQVELLQTLLNKLINAGLSTTGFFGDKTLAAVKSFQLIYAEDTYLKAGLSAPSGVVGELTRQKINALAQ